MQRDRQQEILERTYRWDRWRGGAHGILDFCWSSLALQVAIRIYDAEAELKQWIPASGGLGLVAGVFLSPWLSRRRGSLSGLLAQLWWAEALLILLVLVVPDAFWFVLSVACARLFNAQSTLFQTQLYACNYPAQQRGWRVSMSVLISSATMILSGLAAGWYLDAQGALAPAGGSERLVFAVAGVAAVLGGVALRQTPSPPLSALEGGRIGANLALVWRDPIFGWLLGAWMLMGLGNLMLVPLRVEYLMNEEVGLAQNFLMTNLVLGLMPVCRLLSTRLWGWLFDRMNLITVRVVLNLMFVVSILLFFTTNALWVVALGSALLGFAFGGGGILWPLWVTKLAPPHKVSAYMSLHAFATGVRLLCAPFFGYALLELGGFGPAMWAAVALILLSTLLFLPFRRAMRDRQASELQRPPLPGASLK